MTGPLARFLVTLVVSFGILAPQGSGALAFSGLADGRVLVICTGDGLRTIRIGDDGQPTDLSETADFCALSQALDTAVPALPLAVQVRRLPATRPVLPQEPIRLRRTHRPSLPRAPPAA